MTGPVLDTGRGRPGRWCGWAPLTPGPWLGPDCGPCGRCCDAPRPEPPPRPARCATDPVRVEGQAADGADPLAHEAVVVLDVVDQVPFAVVDGGELIHGAAADRKGCQSRPRAGGDAWRQPAAGGWSHPLRTSQGGGRPQGGQMPRWGLQLGSRPRGLGPGGKGQQEALLRRSGLRSAQRLLRTWRPGAARGLVGRVGRPRSL